MIEQGDLYQVKSSKIEGSTVLTFFRISDEYSIADTGVRFLDTMSLHIAASGMTSGQRMQKQQKNPLLGLTISESWHSTT